MQRAAGSRRKSRHPDCACSAVTTFHNNIVHSHMAEPSAESSSVNKITWTLALLSRRC